MCVASTGRVDAERNRDSLAKVETLVLCHQIYKGNHTGFGDGVTRQGLGMVDRDRAG